MGVTGLILLGLVLLALGGEGLVRGTVGLARRLGLSELLIGLTVVGFGTSAPELITSIDAVLEDAPGISVGNVIGSNISNILLIFGVVAIMRPVAISPTAVKHSGPLVIAVSVLFATLAAFFSELGRGIGIMLVATLVSYIVLVWRMERPHGAVVALHKQVAKAQEPVPSTIWLTLVLTLGGLLSLVVGAELLVQGAITVSRLLGLSETVIGLTIVAIGTSLPELVATLVAAIRGKSDVAFGSIVGSNIYNILGILGITALLHPIAIPQDIRLIDWVTLIGSAMLLTAFARSGRKVSRLEGLALLLVYIAYTTHLLLR